MSIVVTLYHGAQSADAVDYSGCIAVHVLDTTSNEYPGCDFKLCDCKAPARDFWGLWSTSSLPLLPGSLWSEW